MSRTERKGTPIPVADLPGLVGQEIGVSRWITVDQGAGVVFNRSTAIEFLKRRTASDNLQSAINNCSMAEQSACRIEVRPARELCERPDGPDYLVLNARVAGYDGIEWPLPPDFGPGRRSLFLYACGELARNEKSRR